MKSKTIDGMKVQLSSGNAYADLNVPAADTLKAMTAVVIEIRRLINERGFSQSSAAQLMGMPNSALTELMRGNFTGISLQQLEEGLQKLSTTYSSRDSAVE